MFRKIFGLFALVAVLAVGLIVARGVYAQQQGGMGGMMGMMSMMKNCPMMSAMNENPRAVLRHRQELGLTEQQVQRLQALETASPTQSQMMERMQTVHRQIRQVTEGERFDEAAVRAAFDRMGDLHTEMGVAMLRTQHEVRQILTPAQRTKLEELGVGTMGMQGMMHGGMMGGMDMENCPMMKGMMGGQGMMQGTDGGHTHHPRS